MDAYEPLTFEHIDEKQSTVPPPGGLGLYRVAVRLSRLPTEEEQRAFRSKWGSVSKQGQQVQVQFKAHCLLITNTTIEDVVDDHLRSHLGKALEAANVAGKREHEAARAEEERVAAHRAHFNEVAKRFSL